MDFLVSGLKLFKERAGTISDALVGNLAVSLEAEQKFLFSLFGTFVFFSCSFVFAFKGVQFKVNFLNGLVTFDDLFFECPNLAGRLESDLLQLRLYCDDLPLL